MTKDNCLGESLLALLHVSLYIIFTLRLKYFQIHKDRVRRKWSVNIRLKHLSLKYKYPLPPHPTLKSKHPLQSKMQTNLGI